LDTDQVFGRDDRHAALALRLAPLPSATREARRATAEWLARRGVREATRGDTLLVVSELVTNGVLHGGTEDIVVNADDVCGRLTIQVVTSRRPEGLPAFPRNGDGVGRGLRIVAALCECVNTHTDPLGRRTVTCEMNV